MKQQQRPFGELRASLDIPSWRLSQNLPIEIRDSRLNLVGELKHNDSLELKPGWYEVSAVLDDGHRHAETVQVTAGGTSDVKLGVDFSKLMPGDYVLRGLQKGGHRVELLELHGAKVESQNPGGPWVLVPAPGPHKCVPFAHLRVLDEELCVSLPTNPLGHGEHAACVLTFVHQEDDVHVRAGFHPERFVSAAIHNMIDRRQFAQATAAAEVTAEDMLQSKYQDPVGAALGGLIMYRAGTLRRRGSWVNNLQRDFDWLSDGKILLAAIAGKDQTEQKADLLLRASEQRPLFTDCFSILFDALRRWSSSHRRDEITDAARRVARQASRVDWTAFTFTDRPV